MLLLFLHLVLLAHWGNPQTQTPSCSFSNNQCVYNVQLSHQGVCHKPGTNSGHSCCDSVQSKVNSLQSAVENLTKQLYEVQSKVDSGQSTKTVNVTTNETTQLLASLVLKEAELNSSQSNLARLVRTSADVIRSLQEKLAITTRNLNNCKGVLGLKTDKVPITKTAEPVTLHLCTFEDTKCVYQEMKSGGEWKLGHGSQSSYTGPVEDHTYGSPKGHYMYLNALHGSYRNSGNHTVRASSPELPAYPNYCIRFWYNMHGVDIGALQVYIQVSSGLGNPVFSSNGNLGQNWHLGEINLDSENTGHPFHIVFAGVTDATHSFFHNTNINGRGDIAIDDVYAYNTSCKNLPLCPPGAVTRHGNGSSSCYTFHTVPRMWYNSSLVCREEGATSHLVSVNSKEEQEYIVNHIKNNLGLKAAGLNGWYTSGNDERSEGHFDWTDTGTPYMSTYTDWHSGQPNNVGGNQNCLLLQYQDDDFSWGDVSCDEPHPFVCEVDIASA